MLTGLFSVIMMLTNKALMALLSRQITLLKRWETFHGVREPSVHVRS
jgi:hypothetical protein